MKPYLIAVAAVVASVVGGFAGGDHITLADQAMLFLPAILLAALGGRGPALVASGLSVAAFDFFFVPPRFTFAVSDMRSIITFVVMFVVGSASGTLVARLREREQHAAEAALRAKTEELRSALLSSISHDLRTPLAAITGMATAVRQDTHDVRLDTIVEEAQRLERLLTNLLSITKVESGAAPRRDWVPLEEIVGPALERLDRELADHPVNVDVPADVLAHVDPILVELLLLNLLDNAAKHTPAGTPIDVRVWRAADRALLEVADRGPGLDGDARVFEKFYRRHQEVPGAGLGLAVVRGIATAHHGGVDALPRDGGGARFVAWFPDDGPIPRVEDG